MRIFGRGSRPSRPSQPALSTDSSLQAGGTIELLDVAAARIGEVVAAAERAAGEVRAKVDEQGGGSADPREQLALELGRSLADRSQALSQEAAALAAILERASHQLQATAPAEPAQTPPPATAAPFVSAAQTVTAPPAPAAEPPVTEAPAVSSPPPFTPSTARSQPEAAEAEDPDLSERVTERFKGRTDDSGLEPGSFKRRTTVLAPVEMEPTPPRYSQEGVRLLATQMAVAGSTREEIEARLLSEFGVIDASEVLDDVLAVRSRMGSRRAFG